MTEQNNYSVRNGKKEISGVLIHELTHRYGAIDHYHEEDENGNCIRLDVCSQCKK